MERNETGTGADDGERVAVIGMGCRLPGDVDGPSALWRLLAAGRDAVGDPPPTRAGVGGHPDAALPRQGGWLRDVSGFDAGFFGVSGREADVLDPQHRLLLEVTWEALENAGLPPDRLAGTSTGMFTGLSYTDYMDRLAGHPKELEGSILTNGHCVAPGRVSYLLGLNGPCVALDTACSSSLVALHLAGQALRSGECDVALAGGVTLMLASRTTRSFARMGMLSPTGRCHAFDAAADGFVRGEGCAVVVLKRLRDAVRDGDRILAVIRASGVNQDGRSDGLAAPSAAAQEALCRRTVARAAVDPADVGMIEAHGTGTPVGDPTEFASLAAVYGQGRDRCALGSVKTNLGHLEPAAGVTGLVKAVLSLRQGTVPPSLHFTRWNPAITAQGHRFFVPDRLTDWPTRTPTRLAAVSSFGFSGTNAHVVLEQAPTGTGPGRAARRRASAGEAEVLVVPAGSANALPAAARRLADWLEDDGRHVPLRDVAHTLALRRPAGRGRLGVVASSRSALVSGLREFAAGQAVPGVVTGDVGAGISRQPVWLFSGQGSQWAGMARDLLRSEPAFAAALSELDPLIAAESGFSVLDIIAEGHEVTGCGRVQPVLFAVQTALAATWRAYGVQPAGVVGHSMGEVAAAVVAGALSSEDGVRVICRRSALLARIAGAGAMATVGRGREEVEADLAAADAGGSVSVAVLAAPGSTVVAGDTGTVEDLVSAWEARGVPAQVIAVDVASHSPQVEPLLDDLAAALVDLRPRPPEVPFYTTVLDDPREVPAFDGDYWCRNLRRPVRFAAAVRAAAADRHQVYVEVSPHPVVTHSVTGSLRGLIDDPVVLPTLRRGEDGPAALRTHLAALHCAGVPVDWSALYADGHLADVPTIAFDRAPHWVEPADRPEDPAAAAAAAGSGSGSGSGGGQPLPGVRTVTPGEPVRHVWQGDAGTAASPWLDDHRVAGHPVLPGAVYCALALTAGCELFGAASREVRVTDVRFRELLRLAGRSEVTMTAQPTAPDRATVEMFTRGDADDDGDGADPEQWVLRATATVRRSESAADPPALSVPDALREHPVPGDPGTVYQRLRARGLHHGPAFAGLTDLRTSHTGDSVWAGVTVPATAGPTASSLRVHTVLLDLCAQLAVSLLVRDSAEGGLVLPVAARELRFLGDPARAVHGHARLIRSDAHSVTADVSLLDADGRPVIALDALRLLRRDTQEPAEVDAWFYETDWQPAPARATPPLTPPTPGSWLLVGEAGAGTEVLADALRATGADAGVHEVASDGRGVPGLRRLLAARHPQTAAGAVIFLCAPSPAPAPSGARAVRDGDDLAADALDRTRRLLGVAQTIADCPHPPRLYVVTRHAWPVQPAESADPAQGCLRGLVRVLTHEHPEIRATLIDTGPAADDLRETARLLTDDVPGDEVALRDGRCRVARLVPAPLTPSERTAATSRTVRYGEDAFRLRAGRVGDLGSLHLMVGERRAPGPGEVEIAVRAAGLNFRDVLTVMGLLPGSGEEPGPGGAADVSGRVGFECAGIVTAVGTGVEHLRTGDSVLAVDLGGGAFGSFTTVPAAVVAAVPAGVDPVAAAGIPTAYLTAWYALRHVARLTEGERVLVHSATGGTGLAAIAVARHLGAEVLATAGNPEKRGYLRGMGIRHVMDSRSLDFAEQARAATDHLGVDVVLNSLSGAAIRAGLESLRPFGRFVELGVRDILADTSLGLAPFRHNITLSSVDLIELRRARPDVFVRILHEVLSLFEAGSLRPLPHEEFPLTRATEAFRRMAGAGHTGKIVLTVPEQGETTAVRAGPPSPVRAAGAYIVTGGLRGVGLATAARLARLGAGHVVLNGRTPPSASTEALLARLRAGGARVTVELGDVAEAGTAERLVATATADGLPLRGVVHAAMVLDDAVIANITDEQLARVWHPKATGAWRLHEAVSAHSLDWFVAYSSMASLLGNPGQGAYAAANAWLDGFAVWRSAQGLPTLAVNWGAWGETGVATDFAARGYHTIPTEQGLRALDLLLAHRRVRAGVLPGEPATWIMRAVRNAPFFAHLLAGGDDPPAASAATRDIRADLAAMSSGLARRTAIESYLAEQMRTVLQLGTARLDPQTPLRKLGFDSLMSMELRTRLEAVFGIRLPKDFVWKHTTLAALASGLADRMGLPLADADGAG